MGGTCTSGSQMTTCEGEGLVLHYTTWFSGIRLRLPGVVTSFFICWAILLAPSSFSRQTLSLNLNFGLFYLGWMVSEAPGYTYLCLPSVQHLGTRRSKPHTCSANTFPFEPLPWCRPSVSFLGWGMHGMVLTCEQHQEILIYLNFRTHFKSLEHAASY